MAPTLIIIDIQNDYFSGGSMELSGSAPAAANAARILGRFREQGWPLVHIQHLAARPGATFFLKGTPGAEIHPTVAPLAGETVLQKHFPNSFRDTGLLEFLKGAGVTDLVICGMMTNMCVDATVRAAFDLGFTCTVIHDACAARDLAFGGETVPARQVHGAFLAALGAVYANVISTEEYLA
ncbi:cysteine hydrolase family protein [Geobacter sp. SVR]|uniref:cysteine hydrolase family protein n=1 Tax=Geobacter sp. SVR TaxID=2495594 RepID=UPI00143EF68B|nr:cysteine hydrolase family protein [Geobacter sp. SVR]BCS52051.1 isochorismatase [Geobacter sp. SVR]GCF86506.1 isochorismatase [Geobacter sp. SVR]